MDCQDDHVDDDSLIAIVHGHEILWNSKMKHYRNKERKDIAWESVARLMKLAVADVKKDWIRLRTKWGRENRRSLRPMASSGDANTTWPHYKSLAFLKPVVKPRRIASRRRTRRLLTMPSDTFAPPDVKPQLEPMLEPTIVANNELWNTGINVVPFLDNMSVSENCVVEVIQENPPGDRSEAVTVKGRVYPSTAERQHGLKVQTSSDDVEVLSTATRSWHTPSNPEPDNKKRELEDVLENSVSGLVKALKMFISQAATNQKLIAKTENELFVQMLSAMLEKMPAEEARKKKAKLFMVLNEGNE